MDSDTCSGTDNDSAADTDTGTDTDKDNFNGQLTTKKSVRKS